MFGYFKTLKMLICKFWEYLTFWHSSAGLLWERDMVMILCVVIWQKGSALYHSIVHPQWVNEGGPEQHCVNVTPLKTPVSSSTEHKHPTHIHDGDISPRSSASNNASLWLPAFKHIRHSRSSADEALLICRYTLQRAVIKKISFPVLRGKNAHSDLTLYLQKTQPHQWTQSQSKQLICALP